MQKTNRTRTGFTLVELTVVIFLLTLFAGAAATSLRHSLRAVQGDRAAADLVTLLTWARSRAVLEGIPYGVRIDGPANAYRMVRLSTNPSDPGTPLASQWGRPRTLPLPLKFQDAPPLIVFNPNGTSMAQELQMVSPSASWTVTIDALSGRARAV